MPHSRSRTGRFAFTLVELLVVISIIGVLMALLLPAVNAARLAAYRATCQNNQKELGKAVQTYVAAKRKFPSSLSFQPVGSGSYPMPWTVRLFPYIEQQKAYEDIIYRKPVLNDATDPLASQFVTQDGATLTPVSIPVLTCQADADASEPGSLSYVANVGRPDLAPYTVANSQAPRNHKSTGIFHDSRFGHDVSMTYVSEADGTTNTLLFTENRNATTWNDLNEYNFGFVWVDEPGGETAQQPFNDPNSADDPTADTYAMARPSSNHSDVFLNTFADGSVRPLSQEIDRSVFYRLMTPNGAATQVGWQAAPINPQDLQP